MEIIRTLWAVVEKQGDSLSTRQWTMSATCKLVRHLDDIPPEIGEIVSKYSTSAHSDLVQLSHELTELCAERELMAFLFEKYECSVVDEVKVDSKLKFLDHFVSAQRAAGKRDYGPPDEYEADEKEEHDAADNFLFQHRYRHSLTLSLSEHTDTLKMVP